MVGIVEGLDAEGVTDKGKAFLGRVPDSKGEHPIETRQAGGSIFCPRLKEDFRIGLGTKGGSTGFEVTTEFEVVVDFAIKDDVPATIGGGHGLGPAGEVENTEAAMPEADSRIGVGAFRIRAAVGEGTIHPLEGSLWLVGGVTVSGKSGDAAHRKVDSTEEGDDSRLELG